MISIEVVAGFLGAGKTTFISERLKQESLRDKKIIVLQCEEGEEALENPNEECIEVIPIDQIEQLNMNLFRQIKEKYSPDHIMIEYNGTWEIEALLKVKLPRGYKLKNMVMLVAADTFEAYLKNMSAMMIEPITQSDYILVTQHEDQSTMQLSDIKKSVKKLNRGVRYKEVDHCLEKEQELFEEMAAATETGAEEHIYHGMQGMCVILALVTLRFYIKMLQITGDTVAFGSIQMIHSVFIGMLLEMIPFILIGTFIASLLQVLVSGEQLVRVFGKNKRISLPLAIGLGVIFPVCDCALVPIASHMMKKGVSVMHTMLFMLSAMVVNPIVLLSTYYAFSNRPEIVAYRLGAGLVMALAVSCVLALCFKKSKTNGKDQVYSSASIETLPINICSSGYMGKLRFKGNLGKAEAVIRHTTLEFLYILPLAMGGALISSIMQNLFATKIISSGQGALLSFLMVIFASMVMSVCGTSNAFVARGLVSMLPMGHIVGFMIMGPMLDLKNLLLLRGNFSKGFMVVYMGSVVLIGGILVMLCGWM